MSMMKTFLFIVAQTAFLSAAQPFVFQLTNSKDMLIKERAFFEQHLERVIRDGGDRRKCELKKKLFSELKTDEAIDRYLYRVVQGKGIAALIGITVTDKKEATYCVNLYANAASLSRDDHNILLDQTCIIAKSFGAQSIVAVRRVRKDSLSSDGSEGTRRMSDSSGASSTSIRHLSLDLDSGD